ncbi:hypothetical protein AB0D67_19060 [Streptosporangium sp. NPDC048047]|uniref:hypothetical protein n=1 Tax=Streptosporangium sp. NPDC048047 TaxID=3155748 RepID=UPI0034154919
MRIRFSHQAQDPDRPAEDGAPEGSPRASLPGRGLPAAPRRVSMPRTPVRPTRQPRRIPGKGGR